MPILTNPIFFNNEPYLSLDCLIVIQPLGDFYVAAIDSADLAAISETDVRSIRDGEDDYLGIQRVLNPRRVEEIAEYVGRLDAVFPTGIILCIGDDDAIFDEGSKKLLIRYSPGVATILDGQHRLAGLSKADRSFGLNVSVFIGLDLEDQANVFATINLTQAKVNKSLVYDLYEYARHRSPLRTAHRVAVALDRDEISPFHNRIKRLGSAEGDPSRTITQAVLVESILAMITPRPGADRDLARRGARYKKDAYEFKKFPLWPMFVEKDDAAIRDLLRAYFLAISERWPGAWSIGSGSILCRTSGVRSFMRALGYYLAQKGTDQDLPDVAEIVKGFSVSDESFSRERYLPGSAGEGLLYRELVSEKP